jgi:hypothetical protein
MREILIAALTLTTGILASGGQRNARLGALFVAAALILTGLPAGADQLLGFTVTTGSIGGVPTAEVNGDGMVVIRLRSSNSSGLLAKAESVASRLTDLALEGLRPGDVAVQQIGGEWGVTGNGKLIITADAETAAASGLAPRDLCESWRARISEVLTEPYFCITPRDVLVVPFGEQRTIRFGGTIAAKPTVESMAPAVAAVEQQTGQATVRGADTGATVVLVRVGGLQHAITVEVKRWAAQVGTSAALSTLPGGLPDAMRMTALLNAAMAAVRAEPGASVRLDDIRSTAGGCTVSVRASGVEYLPVTKSLPVSIRGGLSPIPMAQTLMISNAPEKVDGIGALMRQSLAPNTPSRLMWHHKNYVGRPVVLSVRLVNAGATPARVRVGWAEAGPSGDEIFVGFNAMVRYWESVRSGQGFLATIPPRSSFETSAVQLAHHDVVSGLMEMIADAGEHLYVEVISREPTYAPAGVEALPGQETQLPLTPFEFPATLDSEVAYEVGGRYGHLSIGRNELQNEQGINLAGAYGVSHRIRVNVSNPTERPAVLELALRAGGGAARSVMMIGGSLNCSGNLHAAGEHLLDRRDLPPGVATTIPLEIIPTAGSNLPFTLEVRSRTR